MLPVFLVPVVETLLTAVVAAVVAKALPSHPPMSRTDRE